jgi:hypothetical protein
MDMEDQGGLRLALAFVLRTVILLWLMLENTGTTADSFWA